MRSPPTAQDLAFLRMAIELAAQHMRAKDGGPFGAVIARGADILARAWNQVPSTNDPTAHAEMTAIRAAAAAVGSPQLRGCVLFTSCEPCPMCLGAAYWARLDRIVFAATRADAGDAGFLDARIYEDLARPLHERTLPMQEALREEAVEVLSEWRRLPDKTPD
jgi:guanine deaminase